MTIDQNYWHRVRRVRGENLSAHRVDHLLCVAMVSGNDYRAAFLPRCRYYTTQTLINRLNSFDRRLEVTGVANHISVRVIHDHNVKATASKLSNNLVGDSIRTHFRLQVIRRNLWRRDQNALLACEWRFNTSIEEKCYVSVLLCLC